MRTSAHCAILRVKSPPRLEPRDIQRFLEHGFAAKRRENTSAPQNGILSQTQQGIPPQGFQNHIPARGRKRLSTYFTPARCASDFKTISPQGDGNTTARAIPPVAFLISKPYPRKGTETTESRSRSPQEAQHFKTISPQGDGNEQVTPSFARLRVIISKPYPRKGTETALPASRADPSSIFQNHIPVRGRKRFG